MTEAKRLGSDPLEWIEDTREEGAEDYLDLCGEILERK